LSKPFAFRLGWNAIFFASRPQVLTRLVDTPGRFPYLFRTGDFLPLFIIFAVTGQLWPRLAKFG